MLMIRYLIFMLRKTKPLDQLFTSVDIKPTATVKYAYATYNQGLWEKLERNEITRDELMATHGFDFLRSILAKN